MDGKIFLLRSRLGDVASFGYRDKGVPRIWRSVWNKKRVRFDNAYFQPFSSVFQPLWQGFFSRNAEHTLFTDICFSGKKREKKRQQPLPRQQKNETRQSRADDIARWPNGREKTRLMPGKVTASSPLPMVKAARVVRWGQENKRETTGRVSPLFSFSFDVGWKRKTVTNGTLARVWKAYRRREGRENDLN